MTQKIIIFIYCYTINDWEERLKRQLNRLITSGLYEAAKDIHLVVSDPGQIHLDTLNIILNSYEKITLDYTARNWFEGTALDKMDKFIKSTDEEYKILYFHVKGVHNQYKNFQTKEPSLLKIKSINCWTEMLEFFLIDKWKECISLLDTHDTVGVANNRNWWWGNFWWTKSSYIKSIVDFNTHFDGSRWSAESWLHCANPNKENIKYFEMFNFSHDPYFSIIPSYFYDGTDLKKLKINVTKAQYGYFAEQRDEVRSLSILEDKMIDITETIKKHIEKNNNKNIEFISDRPDNAVVYDQYMDHDPAFGFTKSLRIWFTTNFDPENEYMVSSYDHFPIRLGYFGKNIKILFLMITSKEHNHNDFVKIDRCDLARKVPAIHTWVEDALAEGHDVVFFDGDNETEYYDEDSKTLHLVTDDRYEPLNGQPSRVFVKMQKALKWALQNKEFDVIYAGDEDIYVNIPEFMKLDFTYDYTSTGVLGGGGYIFSKKAAQILVDAENTRHEVIDIAIYNILHPTFGENNFPISIGPGMPKNQVWYVPAELATTIHYVAGRRMYHVHNIIKHFRENKVTNRKIILGGPFDAYKRGDVVTYETKTNAKTPRAYDYIMDPNGWEYIGGYARSTMILDTFIEHWPFAEKATKYFVLNANTLLHDYKSQKEIFYQLLNKLIERCQYSLIDKNNLILCHHTGNGDPYDLPGWEIDNSVKTSLKLNFEMLNECNFYVHKHNH